MKIIKSSLVSVFLLILFSSLAVAQSLSFNFNNSYATADFSATFPEPDGKNVLFSTQAIKTNDDKDTVTVNFYSESLKNDNVNFLILYTIVPFTPESDTVALDRMLDRGFGNMAMKISTRQNMAFGGLSGRSAAGSNDNMVAFMRVAVTGNRLWSAIVTCSTNYCSQSDADNFFDSVKLMQ